MIVISLEMSDEPYKIHNAEIIIHTYTYYETPSRHRIRQHRIQTHHKAG